MHKLQHFDLVEYVDALLMMAHSMLCCVLVSSSFHMYLETSVLFPLCSWLTVNLWLV